MDHVSITLTVLLVLWGLLGIYVGSRTLKRQRDAGEEAQRRAYLANLGAFRLQQVQTFIQEYEPLLQRRDVDRAVLERVLRDGYTLLSTIADDASAASEDLANESLTNIQNLLSAFHLLRAFLEHGLQVLRLVSEPVESESASGVSEDEEALAGPEDLLKDASRQLRRADTTVRAVRRRVVTAT